MAEMTQRERLLTAIRRDVPDQVPVTWELEHRAALALMGKGGWKGVCDAHREIGSAIFNLQGVGPHMSSTLAPGYADETRYDKHDDGSGETVRTITTPKGSLTERSVWGYIPGDPTLGKRVEYFVKSREDYEILADFVAEGARTATGDATTSAEAREYVGDDGLVGFWIVDAVYETTNSRDMTDFLFDLMDAPQTVCRAMEAFDELKKKQIEAFNESEADVLVYDVCSASTSLLNPQMVADYVIPRARWVAENVSKDKIWGFFTTGKIRAVLPALVDVAPDYIQHFDILGDCDLAEVKREFGSRVAIMGNYSPVVLARGSLADARQEAKRCLDAAMAGGGYAITTSDEVPADAKMDNMKAVVEYVNTHGRY